MYADVSKSYRGGVAGYFWNFAVDSAELRPAHNLKLAELARIFLSQAKNYTQPTVWVGGLASRTGSSHHNHQLARSRALSVSAHLLQLIYGRNTNTVFNSTTYGEEFWKPLAVPDGYEHPQHRAVLVLTSDAAPAPPTPALPERRASITPCCLLRLEIDVLTRARTAWTLSLGSGFKDRGGGRYTSPDRTQLRAAFASWGGGKRWTSEELIKRFSWILKVKLEDAAGMSNQLSSEIERLQEQMATCLSRDEHNICATSVFNPSSRQGRAGSRSDSMDPLGSTKREPPSPNGTRGGQYY